jgi:hypothetical protein
MPATIFKALFMGINMNVNKLLIGLLTIFSIIAIGSYIATKRNKSLTLDYNLDRKNLQLSLKVRLLYLRNTEVCSIKLPTRSTICSTVSGFFIKS